MKRTLIVTIVILATLSFAFVSNAEAQRGSGSRHGGNNYHGNGNVWEGVAVFAAITGIALVGNAMAENISPRQQPVIIVSPPPAHEYQEEREEYPYGQTREQYYRHRVYIRDSWHDQDCNHHCR